MSSDRFYADARVLVTGATGFLGRHLVVALRRQGAHLRAAGTRPRPAWLTADAEYVQADLRRREECQAAMTGVDMVFHLAAVGWGLHENMRRQPELLTENTLLSFTVLDSAHRAGVSRFLYTSSSAVYPADLEQLQEDADWGRPPHPSEECFGWAKRMGEIQAAAYHRYYGMAVAIVRPSNPYGPWDSIDPERSHVIPALIRRALAREDPFVVWGTGQPVRSFVYATDVVRGMLLALEHAADAMPINLASDEATSIRGLVDLVLEVTDHRAEVKLDSSRPDGHPRKLPSVDRLRGLGIDQFVSLREGLADTVAWYRGAQVENR